MTPLPEPTQAPDLRFPIAWAIGVARAKGFAVGFNGFIDSDRRCCCPIGAIVLATAREPSAFNFATDVVDFALTVLSVPRQWIDGFVTGFDEDGLIWTGSSGVEGAALGREFRRALDEGRL